MPARILKDMSCTNKYQKSSLRAYNTTEQTFTITGSNIVFSTIGYQSGTSIDFTAGDSTILLRSPGLYYVTLDMELSNETALTDTIVQIYFNGEAVTGATTTATITATGDTIPSTISAVIPVGCVCPCSNKNKITFLASGTTAVVNNVNVNVIRLA